MRTLRRWVYWRVLVRFNRIAAKAFTWSDDAMMAFVNYENSGPRIEIRSGNHHWVMDL